MLSLSYPLYYRQCERYLKGSKAQRRLAHWQTARVPEKGAKGVEPGLPKQDRIPCGRGKALYERVKELGIQHDEARF